MDNHFVSSRKFKGILIAIGAIIILLIVFRAGMGFGYRRALFSEQWGKNYERNFLGPRPGLGMRGFNDPSIMNSHGASGSIIKVNADSIIIKGDDGLERNILVGTTTVIKQFQDTVKITDLKVNDRVVVIGEPSAQGEIDAKLIRIFPR